MLAAALASCAAPGPTPYGAKFGAFGYVDEKRDDGTWRVRFTGNSETPRATVLAFALYRAAEITLGAGYEQFAILDRSVERPVEKREGFIRPPPLITRESTDRFETTLDPGRPDPVARRAREWLTAIVIVMPYRGAPPPAALRLENARGVIERIGPMVKRKG